MSRSAVIGGCVGAGAGILAMSLGFGFSTWQFWAVYVAVVGCFNLGAFI